jgi:predicted amidohydrolase YtcJ
MKKIGLLFVGLVAELWLGGALGWAAADAPVLIRGVDVYPVAGPVMKSVSVLVENGKIADIGAKVAAPKGARIVEGKGLRVYPGLIDSATELGLSEIAWIPVNWASSCRNCARSLPSTRAVNIFRWCVRTASPRR